MTNAKIAEIFSSIQGEGPFIGYKQLFIRFSGCNLHCNYCDTKFNEDLTEYSAEDLAQYLQNFNLKSIHSISLTGGEPLLSYKFLKEFLPIIKSHFNGKIYLETNATLPENLEKIVNEVDIISADIKLPSVSGVQCSFALHDEFFKITDKYQKHTFAKIVFDANILDDEIQKCVTLAEKYNLELILQPKTVNDSVVVKNTVIVKTLDKFLTLYSNVRLIPQVHKFLNIE